MAKPLIFNHNSPQYISCCGCHYKTGAIAVGCIAGIPICLIAFQQAMAALHSDFFILVILFTWSFIKISSVVSFFVGIFTYNSKAVTPFIWILYLLVFYCILGFGMGFLFLATDSHIRYPTIIEFIVPSTISHRESIDFPKVMTYYTFTMAASSGLFMWFCFILIHLRYYIRDWEEYNQIQPEISDPDSATAY